MKQYTKTITITKPRLVIGQEDNPSNPREDSNLGYFISVSSKYNSPDYNEALLDIVKSTGNEAQTQQDHMQMIKEQYQEQSGENVLAIYPITIHEHGNIYYKLGTVTGFDNSNNSFYIVTEKSADIVGTEQKDFEKVIKAELDMYNKYVNGEILFFKLYDDKGEEIDSCSNFYSLEEIASALPDEWGDEDLAQYLK